MKARLIFTVVGIAVLGFLSNSMAATEAVNGEKGMMEFRCLAAAQKAALKKATGEAEKAGTMKPSVNSMTSEATGPSAVKVSFESTQKSYSYQTQGGASGCAVTGVSSN